MTLAIEAKHIRKTFKDFWHREHITAVHDVSLEVQAGTVHGLLGPNGSGKSTSLKMLLGLLKPTSGSVRVLAGNPQKSEIQHRIGYLPEVSTMYQYLTAEETLYFYGSLFDLPKSMQTARIGDLLRLTGLTRAAKRPVGEFSRGMNRRLGLAQALINNPDLLVLDEPTAGLDPIGCHHVKNMLRSLANAGKTVLIASHLLADIEDICSNITILHHGHVIAKGPIKQLLSKEDTLTFSCGSLSEKHKQKLARSIEKMTGASPDITASNQDLESFFVQCVQQAGQPLHAVSATDATELQLPDFLQQREPQA
jgi:ABC-2 type transport system ATP-binding protein